MQWSAVKHRFESLLAEKLKGRLRVHLTEYTKAAFDIGRGWISLDGQEVVSIQIPSVYEPGMRFGVKEMNFGSAVARYINLPFEQIKASDDPLIQGLAFLDKRYGRRSLKQVKLSELHAFASMVYQLRCQLEGIQTKPVSQARTEHESP